MSCRDRPAPPCLTRFRRDGPFASRRPTARDALPPSGSATSRRHLRDAHEQTGEGSPRHGFPPARRGRFGIDGWLLSANRTPATFDESTHRGAGRHCRACAHEHPRRALLPSLVHCGLPFGKARSKASTVPGRERQPLPASRSGLLGEPDRSGSHEGGSLAGKLSSDASSTGSGASARRSSDSD
jgi:hypothetical protein